MSKEGYTNCLSFYLKNNKETSEHLRPPLRQNLGKPKDGPRPRGGTQVSDLCKGYVREHVLKHFGQTAGGVQI